IPVPSAMITTMSIHVTCALLDTGRFLSVLPSSLLAFSPLRNSLCVLPVSVPETSGPVGITTVRQRSLTPVAKLFIDYARKVTDQLANFNFQRPSNRSRARTLRQPRSALQRVGSRVDGRNPGGAG